MGLIAGETQLKRQLVMWAASQEKIYLDKQTQSWYFEGSNQIDDNFLVD